MQFFTLSLSFLADKMIDLSVAEHKRLIMEARASRRTTGGTSMIKSYIFMLETRASKKRKGVGSKDTSSVLEPHISVSAIHEEVQQSTPKRMKTLMSDEVCRDDMEITSLMREPGNSHASGEFKFWSNSFDGLQFLYDHLNTIEDVNKVKSVGHQKMTHNLSSYLMRRAVLTHGLF